MTKTRAVAGARGEPEIADVGGRGVLQGNGATPLMVAAVKGHEGAAKLLMATADAKAEDKTGWRASHLALYAGAEALARMLVEKEEEEGPVDARLFKVRDDVQARRDAPLAVFGSYPSLDAMARYSMIDIVNRTVTFMAFSTVRFKRGCPAGKRAYYELTVKNPSPCPQFGFATSGLESSELTPGNGVGDNAKSWAVDGVRCKKWHPDNEEEYGAKWSAGDVIGVAWDGVKREIAVSVNGDFAPPNGVQFQLHPEADAPDMHPAFSAKYGGVVEYNFGEGGRAFAYKPPSEDYVGFGMLETRSE